MKKEAGLVIILLTFLTYKYNKNCIEHNLHILEFSLATPALIYKASLKHNSSFTELK